MTSVVVFRTPCLNFLEFWYLLPHCKATSQKDKMHFIAKTLHWRHNDHNGVSNHQPHGCLLNRLFGRRSKKTSNLRVTGLCMGNSPGPVNSPHKGPVTRKMFPFDDVIMNGVKTETLGRNLSTLLFSSLNDVYKCTGPMVSGAKSWCWQLTLYGALSFWHA